MECFVYYSFGEDIALLYDLVSTCRGSSKFGVLLEGDGEMERLYWWGRSVILTFRLGPYYPGTYTLNHI